MTGYEQTPQTVWLDVTIERETDKAVFVDNGKRRAWIPKSQILDSEGDVTVGASLNIELPAWLAEKNELV